MWQELENRIRRMRGVVIRRGLIVAKLLQKYIFENKNIIYIYI